MFWYNCSKCFISTSISQPKFHSKPIRTCTTLHRTRCSRPGHLHPYIRRWRSSNYLSTMSRQSCWSLPLSIHKAAIDFRLKKPLMFGHFNHIFLYNSSSKFCRLKVWKWFFTIKYLCSINQTHISETWPVSKTTVNRPENVSICNYFSGGTVPLLPVAVAGHGHRI